MAFRGEVAVITGAGGGLGRAYAERLAGSGARVAVVDIDESAATATATSIRERGGNAIGLHADVAEEKDVDRMRDSVLHAFGTIDVLVNNAGGALGGFVPTAEIDRAHWDRVLAVNLTGAWLCTRAVLPTMRAAGRGKIINISTTMTSTGSPTGMAPYVAAKAGIVGLTRTLAREVGADGICVNAIAPGMVPMDKASAGDRAPALRTIIAEVRSQQAIPRSGEPADLCGIVEFLASPGSDFITGQVVNVDGGWVFS